MKCVYLIQSLSNLSKRYIGKTSNLEQRLSKHNAGKSPHTAQYLPWKLEVAIYFTDDKKAHAFEYLMFLKDNYRAPLVAAVLRSKAACS